jgi:glycine oxidase
MRIGIIGCGVVGAAIAYRLSQIQELEVMVWDKRSPDQWEATGAALGVLMAILSPKLKGKHLQLRLQSLTLYESLIPELEALTGQTIPYNRKGILQLCFAEDSLERWQRTQRARAKQGFILDLWSCSQLIAAYPELTTASLEGAPAIGAIYSPDDRQLHPVTLTQVLIQGAQHHSAQFHWHCPIQSLETSTHRVSHVTTQQGQFAVDGLIVAAGLGSTSFTQALHHDLQLAPVLGQALQLELHTPLPHPWPVVNGGDIHLVPLNDRELWVGATVELPDPQTLIAANPDPLELETVLQRAIALYPPLKQAKTLRTWQGLRPRPCDRAAPVIETVPQFQNVILATGHYRNGVLLAPITAEKVATWIQEIM